MKPKITHNNPFYDIEPANDAPIEEWKEWAFKLRETALKLQTDEKKRIGQLRKLRKELTKKNKVFAIYKKQIKGLESEIEKIEDNLICKFIQSMRRYFQANREIDQ